MTSDIKGGDQGASVSGRNVDIVDAIDRNPLSPMQWRVIVLCFLVALVDGFDTQVIGYVAPGIAREFEIDATAMGFGFSAGLFGLMIGAAALSAAADRIGRKPAIVLSCALMGIFSLLTAFAPSFELFLFGRFLTGVGLGGALPVINAITAEYVPARRRAMFMTVMFSGVPIGAMLAGLLANALMETVSWREIFLIGSLLPILVGLAVAAKLPESMHFLAAFPKRRPELIRTFAKIDRAYTPTASDRFIVNEVSATRGSLLELFRQGRAKTTLLLWTIFTSNLFMVYAIVSWLPSIMSAAGTPLRLAVFSTILFNLGGITLGLLLARFSDRWGVMRVAPWAFAGAAVSIASVGLEISSPLSAFAIIGMVGGFVGGAQFSIHLLAVSLYPSSIRSLGLGAALSVGRIGGILGPLLMGAAISIGWSNEILFALAAFPALIGLLAMLALSRHTHGELGSARQQGGPS